MHDRYKTHGVMNASSTMSRMPRLSVLAHFHLAQADRTDNSTRGKILQLLWSVEGVLLDLLWSSSSL
jgi:hypothetical protein